ncbi:L-2 [[Clostridium] sordellii]|uniref:L-2,4-diaminobutyrate decarboxylase n=1 Tax=Paraclostridium sordellii TaxID=1505 RepID=A0ABM9RKF7_PARSO|nr:pyridoxal-dependent decarboxylase [Paeniclostridium sordellii]CEJ72458.1 putative L-2,4-diaminobutyrate decarboxylase [[Clostridium] sordellii] [Paeniclostridium sordellii]CEN70684.1 L-2 [[Clostridium] sordellii] [Paeniclostridium sordellii]CEN73819.1 L-2 [[Clostridium] sordellii] [Paeniclostridium sordellii]CEO28794.1 L-2 [[Clostridium] sordellii] [Paeniclostridium sordellii]CEP77108.1 L-2 [[Clostridium] sordellii] [Paeniclostridium sordellii]
MESTILIREENDMGSASLLNSMELEKEFLKSNESNFDVLLQKISAIHEHLNNKDLNPKFKVNTFSYNEILDEVAIPEKGSSSEEVFENLSELFEGSIRTQSPYSLFNMVPSPLIDTVAASTITQLYNTNSLMDSFGGKVLLFEQKIARMLGKLAGWNDAHGVACNGGKLTLLYAVKSAISKIDPDSRNKGIDKNLVVLTNESSHYCVEHVCSILGLGSDNCIRIKSEDGWKMNIKNLLETIEEQHKNGKKVAAIICAGGTTINFACDDTVSVYKNVKELFENSNQDYFPYFHLDSVIGWLWMNFIGVSESELNEKIQNEKIRNKIMEVVKRIEGISNFDSFGVDMHKNGLCPYSTSMFISKTDDNFDYLNDGKYSYGEDDYEFGNFRAYRYTFENSRPATGIVNSWIAMNRLGRTGFQDYLIKLKSISEELKTKLEESEKISILNKSLGWEIVFDIDFNRIEKKYNGSYESIAKAFMQYCWDEVNAGKVVPLISIVPEYKIYPGDINHTAFLIFPMSMYLDSEIISDIVIKLNETIDEFEAKVLSGDISIGQVDFEKPIR